MKIKEYQAMSNIELSPHNQNLKAVFKPLAAFLAVLCKTGIFGRFYNSTPVKVQNKTIIRRFSRMIDLIIIQHSKFIIHNSLNPPHPPKSKTATAEGLPAATPFFACLSYQAAQISAILRVTGGIA